MSQPEKVTRRQFIHSGTASAAALGAASVLATPAHAAADNERLRIGFIGVGRTLLQRACDSLGCTQEEWLAD